MSKSLTVSLGLGVLVAALLGGCATTGGQSDEELIQALVDQFVAANEAADFGAIVALCTEDFESEWGGPEDFKSFMEGVKEQGFLNNIEIDIDDMAIAIEGATATVNGIMTSTDMASDVESTMTLRKTADGWRMCALEVMY